MGPLNPYPIPDSWDTHTPACLQGLCYFSQLFSGFPLQSSEYDSCNYSWSFSGFKIFSCILTLSCSPLGMNKDGESALQRLCLWFASGSDSLMAILNNYNYKHSISKACTGWIDCHIEIHSHYQYLRMGRAGGYPNYKVDAPLKLFWGTLSS